MLKDVIMVLMMFRSKWCEGEVLNYILFLKFEMHRISICKLVWHDLVCLSIDTQMLNQVLLFEAQFLLLDQDA